MYKINYSLKQLLNLKVNIITRVLQYIAALIIIFKYYFFRIMCGNLSRFSKALENYEQNLYTLLQLLFRIKLKVTFLKFQ